MLFSISIIAQSQSRNQNIISGEYFINQDPGEGKGFSLSSTYGFALADVSFKPAVINNDAVYVRFKSSNGKWGSPRSFKYKLPLTLSGAVTQVGEYYVNKDLGYGKATGFNIGDNGIIKLLSIKINRNDRIFVRAKDSFGRWGEASSVRYRYKSLTDAEYKIKFKGGYTAAWQKLKIQNQQYPSAYYTALTTVTGIDKNTIDTVFVRFQTKDFIWGIPSNNLITGIKEVDEKIPTEFSLSQNFPNPFNPTTKIRFDVSKQSHVKLFVYDILGREIETVVDKEMNPGGYEVTLESKNLSSGVYFYRINAGKFQQMRKMLLLK